MKIIKKVQLLALDVWITSYVALSLCAGSPAPWIWKEGYRTIWIAVTLIMSAGVLIRLLLLELINRGLIGSTRGEEGGAFPNLWIEAKPIDSCGHHLKVYRGTGKDNSENEEKK
jgi:hypothetical protein